jgi:hypothetical protein
MKPRGVPLIIEKDFYRLEQAEALNTFVIQHNWAAAFEGATDFDMGDFRLPYERAAFELHITGKRIIAIVSEAAGSKTVLAFVTTKVGWVAPDKGFSFADGEWGRASPDFAIDELYDFLLKQIRAICISLEAKVAVTDIVTISPQLNRSRERRNRTTLSNYHVVRLNHRPHSTRAAHDEARRGKRLHFRRGHWRHYDAERKTWISWMLVGNPDLGFIEKEYRL